MMMMVVKIDCCSNRHMEILYRCVVVHVEVERKIPLP